MVKHPIRNATGRGHCKACDDSGFVVKDGVLVLCKKCEVGVKEGG